MNDYQSSENAATTRDAIESAGHPQTRGSRAGDIEAGLMRYLAAERYHEKVEEIREAEAEDRRDPPR